MPVRHVPELHANLSSELLTSRKSECITRSRIRLAPAADGSKNTGDLPGEDDFYVA